MTRGPSDPVRVAVLHSQRAWVEALEQLVGVGLGLTVTVAHTSPEWVHGAVERGEVDVVLLGLDGTFGPQHVQALRALKPQPDVIVISDQDDADLVVATVRAGAAGWLRPTATSRELEQMVQGVVRGEAWLPPDLTAVVLEHLLKGEQQRTASVDALSELSPRELEVLECLAQGMSRADIAERYTLSPHTVRTHINHILRKLDAHTTLAAVLVMRRARIPQQRSSD